VSIAPARGAGAAAPGLARRRWRPRRPSRRLLAGLALLLAAAGVAGVVANPFRGAGGASGGAVDNGSATSLATVTRRSLAAQTQVSGRLGYAGSSTILVPAGTAPADREKARQVVTAAEVTLRSALATLAADGQALARVQAKLAADRQKLASDCRGDAAATAASGTGSDATPNSGSTPCATAAQAVTSDEESVATAEQKVATDAGPAASARAGLSAARESLASADSSAVAYQTSAAYTMLPAPGDVIRRGRPLYAIGGQPVLLLYGRVTAWRPFRAGVSPGRDVAALNANLRALGYGGQLGDRFTAATAQAIRALQAAHGLARTGALLLGSVAFAPDAVRVKSAQAKVGAAVAPGPALQVSSTRHRVTVALNAAQQSEVEVGDQVTVTMPDTRTTRGVVSSVGQVASAGTEGGTPTIPVSVKLADEAAAGRLDQAPVQVSITTASVKDVLVVPVNALLALAGGGYAVEAVDPAGVHRLVPVELGIFDDSEGLVEVSGSRLRAGQRIVVPGS
jgi:peptidoglycan hydrolase-like protein with peptidoglycan-binding domain